MDEAIDILILIRHFTRLTETLQLHAAFMQSGSSVSIVLLGPAHVLPCRNVVAGLPGCSTTDPRLADFCGIPLLSLKDLAQRIEQADLVMPC